MKNTLRNGVITAIGAAGLFPVLASAQAVPPDFTSLTDNIDVSSTIEAILSVGATLIGVSLAVMGFRYIRRMFSGN